MGKDSKIEWTDHTFNPWYGCTKISPACDHCYAESWAKRSGLVEWGNHPRKRTSEAYWRQPLKWNRVAERDGVRRKVFCASLADVFDNQVDPAWRCDLWDLIAETPHLDWLLLTKRPQNIRPMLPGEGQGALQPWGPDGYPNVWLGTTIESSGEAWRVFHLLNIPAAKRFLSCEPLLGPIDLRHIDIDGHAECDVLHMATAKEVWDDCWAPEKTGTTLADALKRSRMRAAATPPVRRSATWYRLGYLWW